MCSLVRGNTTSCAMFRLSQQSQQSQALVIPVPRHTAGVRKQTEVRNGQFLVNFRHPN